VIHRGAFDFVGPIGDGGAGYGLTVDSGAVVLSARNSYTGPTRLNSGILRVNGSIPGSVEVNAGSTLGGSGVIGGNVAIPFTNSGSRPVLAPGNNNVGTLKVNGNLSLGSTTESQFELAGTNNYDRLNVGGSATLGGTLNFSLVSGFTPSFGDRFHIITAGSRTGTFDGGDGASFASGSPGVRIVVTYSPTEVLLSAPLPGDANLDNVVGAGDFNLLASNFGKSGQGWKMGDFTGDGVVGAGDFNLLASNFGRSVGGPGQFAVSAADVEALQAFAAANVPEPAGFAAGAASLVLLGTRRRRRGHA
jgi:autotransporter-associated beta strand protein